MLLSLAVSASAHDGPPFPIIVDKQVGPYVVSVWTDPDVGTGTFFVIVNVPPGGSVPGDLQVDVAVQPVSARLAEATHTAQREDLRGQVQYKALIPLDAQELWRVRVVLRSAQGGGEASADVEATPPGLGRWDLLLYLLPFLGIGFLWLRAITRKRAASKRQLQQG